MTFGRREVLCIVLEEDGIMYELWEKLEELKNELLESNKVFSIAHTEVFIQNVQKLLEKNSL